MELSNYFIDLLKDDFCTPEPDGFYSLKIEEKPTQPMMSPKSLKKQGYPSLPYMRSPRGSSNPREENQESEDPPTLASLEADKKIKKG
mmetsp:Transcript_28266/g.42795  ORF Transcript_28266/g.42795 Transcript_28266/m.42795 type:complete len:88 (+) Transcript_28266:243-506(+)